MPRRFRARICPSFLLLTYLAAAQSPCPVGKAKSWPKELLPPADPRGQHAAYDQRLLDYMKSGAYRNLGWCVDKAIRGTGPYYDGENLGTHYAAVRIWYSPEVVEWLEKGQAGELPDGAVIIKEQFQPKGQPSAPPGCFQYMDWKKIVSGDYLGDWNLMIKRKDASKDGWYWTEVYDGMTFPSIAYPKGGYGQYCLRCHASAEKEYTFSTLNNIKGFPGQYITFYQDDSWRENPGCQPQSPPASGRPLLTLRTALSLSPEHPSALTAAKTARLISDHEKQLLAREATETPLMNLLSAPSLVNRAPAVAQAPSSPCTGPSSIQCMVPEPFDRTVPPPKDSNFVTSDQCQGCHSSNRNWMFIALPNPPSSGNTGINISPYGEWRWSPMGLAGRDPVFYAQVESELAYIATVKDPAARQNFDAFVKNTCFHCHGVMGQRTFEKEYPNATFDPVVVTERDNPYGGLARDGISCSACHRIQADYGSLADFLNKGTTGNFNVIPPGEVQGPFADDHVIQFPMDNGLGFKPKYNEYTMSSRLCGSCHVINLPVVDHPPVKPVGPQTEYDVEQNTYTEWLNSQFENEFQKDNPKAKTCQDCHMKDSYVSAAFNLNVTPLPTKIAVIEDDQYPAAEHRAPLDKITVTYRSTGYRRHELVGLNGFMLKFFDYYMTEDPLDKSYYNYILGVRQADYMSGLTNDLPNAIGNIVEQAQTSTAKLDVKTVGFANGTLTADVTVQNETGHRMPSGVGFRRAFLQFTVSNKSTGKVLWQSGVTDDRGVILGANGKPLPSEFFDINSNGKQQYQEHHDVKHPVTSLDEVQIYEELIQDADHQFTTSFIRRDHHVKDNRLLPVGWRENAPIPQPFLKDTYPVGRAWDDPVYHNGLGQSIVRYQAKLSAGVNASDVQIDVALYYQSLPPYFLKMRYDGAPNGPATQRLKYLAEHLDLKGTAFENWKLQIAKASDPSR
jgi:hypothetical protein